MKIKLNTLALAMATSVAMLGGAPAQADYVVSGHGGENAVVKDPYGKCVRTPQWTEDTLVECGMAAAAEPKVEAPQPVRKDLTLGADANFDFDKSTLKPAGMASLDKLVDDMRGTEIRSISVVGHTDSIGSDAYNQGLSERRAASVKSYLEGKGVAGSLITTRGMGESQPIASNKTREGRAQNRRVEIAVDAVKVQ